MHCACAIYTPQVQNAFKAVSTNSRTLTITLYLTGCKPEQLAPEANPKPGSTAELIKALQASAVSKSEQESSIGSGGLGPLCRPASA